MQQVSAASFSPNPLQHCQEVYHQACHSERSVWFKMIFSILQSPVVILALSVFATAAAQQDCATSQPVQAANSAQNQTICLQNGTERNYTLYIPEDYAPGSATLHPLILSFHGGTETPENQMQLDLLTNPFFNTDAVVAYPSGLDVCLLCALERS
jgi:poly(3-hydroxybutyrate) depolymerase